MSQTEKPFTVSDRRHFTPEGRPRDEDEEGPAPGGEDASRGTAREAPAPAPDVPGEVRSAHSTGAAADFSQFLLTLGAQAGMLLSGQGLAEGTGPAEALEGARSVIAILEMLQGKTEGRRTAAEDALLSDLLFQLRMAYVEKKRAGSP